MPIQQDLYSHLTEVFNRIMMHHPEDAYDKFEDISALVKKTNFKIRDPDFDYVVNEKAGVISNKEALEFIERVKNLLNIYPDLLKKDERKLINNSNNCKIENFLEHTDSLEWAGISFGDEMHLLIQKSL